MAASAVMERCIKWNQPAGEGGERGRKEGYMREGVKGGREGGRREKEKGKSVQVTIIPVKL